MKKFFSLLIIAVLGNIQIRAQIGIGTENPDLSSALHVNSSNKGILIPNVSLLSNTDTATINSAAPSLLVFNTSSSNGLIPGFYYWYDNQWNRLSNGLGTSTSGGWSLSGNMITSSDFLGTINYQNLILKVNNNQIGKFTPNGGISIGNGANANDYQSVAIGVNANASANTQATAVGYGSVSSGYQSTSLGYGSVSSNNSSLSLGFNSNASGFQSTALGYNSRSNNNSSTAIGNESFASGMNSTALGNNSSASGSNSTAIGYFANTSQANAIVLGNSSDVNNKVGIGTNSPDERLHVVGKIKIADGTQSNGYVLTSDSNGTASWKSPDDANNIAYAQTHKSSNTTLNSYDGILLGSACEMHNLSISSNYIQTQTKTGIYRITYTVSIRKNAGTNMIPEFYLTLNGNEIAGSRSSTSIATGETRTVTLTSLVNINSTYQLVRIMSNTTDNDTEVLAGSTNLLVEFVR